MQNLYILFKRTTLVLTANLEQLYLMHRYYSTPLAKGKSTLFLFIVVTYRPVNDTKEEGYLEEWKLHQTSAFWERKHS